MNYLKCFCLIVIVTAFICPGCSQQQAKIPALKLFEGEDHWVDTADGWTLHVRRYKPQKVDNTRCPVILCHGLSHNNVYWDLTKRTSLARYLRDVGYDVWSVSLRGAGQSTKPKLSQLKQLFRLNVSVFNPSGLANRRPAILKQNWTVDDHINFDAPAVIDHVLKQTGKDKVHWIGHSMGGMIMFGYLQTKGQDKIKTFVGISSPMLMLEPLNDVYELLVDRANFAKIGNIAAGTNLRAIFGTLAGRLSGTPIDDLFMNADNVSSATMHAFFYACEEDISPGQLDQLIRFLQSGHFKSYKGKIDYTAGVDEITIPVLQLVGQLDNMIRPGFVSVIHNRLGSDDKKMKVFGRINGYSANYGHDDIIIGQNSRRDVFGVIKTWLDGHKCVNKPL